MSEQDLSSNKSCGSDCDCSCSQYSCQSDHTEFEVVSSSSSCHNINDPNSSDSFTSVDYEVKFGSIKNTFYLIVLYVHI